MSARKYPCGNDKRKKKKKQEQLTQALSGSLNKYFTTSSQRETLSVENLVSEEAVNVNPDDRMDIVDREEREVDNSIKIPPAQEDRGEPLDIYDPSNWKSVDHKLVDLLVEKGPIRVEMEESEYPRDVNKRHFSNVHYTRCLTNGEKHDRRWLVYSKSSDKVFCFCCKLFKEDKKGDSRLVTTGFRDWHNTGSRLKQHETSSEHIMCMHKWIDLETRLRRNQTIDKVVQQRITVEKEDNRQVFTRVMGAIKCLVKNNLGNCGFIMENASEEEDDVFLGMLEMVAMFDPVMRVYLERRESKDVQYDYLSHEARIELIQLLANEVKSAILEKIKKAKYFSVILDWSLEKQASLLIRCVNDDDIPVKVVEYFLGYIKADDTTGMGLFSELEKALSRLGLKIQDIRGQAYGNGVDIKGRRKCIQSTESRLLSINPRAFYAPYDGHNLNLAFCDMANYSPKAMLYFGSVQCLYDLFSSSTKWWDVLKRYVNDLTLEPLSQSRWESHIESVKTIKFNALKISDALFEIASSSGDSLTTSQARRLATDAFESFEFLVSTMIWYEVLYAVSTVSKTLQNEDMRIDVAIDQLKTLIARFREYREHGFNDALIEAQELAREMDLEPVFYERRTCIHRRVQFDDEGSSEQSSLSPQESFRIEFFLYIVDKALTSLNEILEQFCAYERNFGFLFDLKKCVDDASLKNSCENLSNVLSHNGQVDLDANELFMELRFLRSSMPSEIREPKQVLNYLKQGDNGFPNTEIAYRIMLTIPVTVPSGQRSSSKLELVRNYYLQSTTSEECLNELAMISLENDMVEKIEYSTLFDKFTSQRVRRSTFK